MANSNAAARDAAQAERTRYQSLARETRTAAVELASDQTRHKPPRTRDARSIRTANASTSSGHGSNHVTPARLEGFVAVAEEGGFSAAARRLHISQPALSHNISALEDQFGVELFVRNNSGVHPTPAGRALLDEARAILAGHHQMLRVMTGHAGEGGGVIGLGIPLLLAPNVLRVLATFAADHPATRFNPGHHSSMTAQLDELRSGRMDVSFLRDRPVGIEFDAILVAKEDLGVLLATDLAAERGGGGAVGLDALRGLRWLSCSRSSSPSWHDEIASVLRGYGLDVGAAAADNGVHIPSVMLAAVSAREGFALVPRHCTATYPDTVTWSPITGHSLVQRTWAVWRASTRRRDIARLITAFDLPEDG